MELIVVECPKCKGTVHIDKGTAKCFCIYCRTEIQVKNLSSEREPGIHHEFEAKLALARHAEKLYFKDENNFDEVLRSYDDVRQVGAHHAEYWLSRSRFYAKGMLREFDKGRIRLVERQTIINQYTFWMNTAVEYYKGLVAEIEVEKNKVIAEINEAFDSHEAEEKRKHEGEEARKAERRKKDEEQAERDIVDAQLRRRGTAERRRKKAIITAVISVVIMIFIISSMIVQLIQDHVGERRVAEQATEEHHQPTIQANEGYESEKELGTEEEFNDLNRNDLQVFILKTLNNKERTEPLNFENQLTRFHFGVRETNELKVISDLSNTPVQVLEEHPYLLLITVRRVDINGVELSEQDLIYASEETFLSWDFWNTYVTVQGDIGEVERLQISITEIYDFESEFSVFTREDVEQIEYGMSLAEVVSILGREGFTDYSPHMIYRWQQGFSDDMVTISITFQNDSVTRITQSEW